MSKTKKHGYLELVRKFRDEFLPHQRAEVEFHVSQIDDWLISNREYLPRDHMLPKHIPDISAEYGLTYEGFVHRRGKIIGAMNLAASRLGDDAFSIDYKGKERYHVHSNAISATNYDGSRKRATRDTSISARYERKVKSMDFDTLSLSERNHILDKRDEYRARAEKSQHDAIVDKKYAEEKLKRLGESDPNSLLFPQLPVIRIKHKA